MLDRQWNEVPARVETAAGEVVPTAGVNIVDAAGELDDEDARQITLLVEDRRTYERFFGD